MVQIVIVGSSDDFASCCITEKTRDLKVERSIFVVVNIRCWHSRDSVGLEITVIEVGLNSDGVYIVELDIVS